MLIIAKGMDLVGSNTATRNNRRLEWDRSHLPLPLCLQCLGLQHRHRAGFLLDRGFQISFDLAMIKDKEGGGGSVIGGKDKNGFAEGQVGMLDDKVKGNLASHSSTKEKKDRSFRT